MDVTSQIKNNLISRIESSKDLDFLRALQTLFDTSEQELYQLSSEQKEAISKGRKQIKSGESSSHDVVISEMKEWLLKK